ncbi:hypothetical protein [Nonomuraea typhae]|uniref:hypothetical protein n=1 Tax=Nonomuraea typhae TaxID=2603600 RepID=UPI0012F8D31C|nr:hypothetical protein [Nonomuraea typhae]
MRKPFAAADAPGLLSATPSRWRQPVPSLLVTRTRPARVRPSKPLTWPGWVRVSRISSHPSWQASQPIARSAIASALSPAPIEAG